MSPPQVILGSGGSIITPSLANTLAPPDSPGQSVGKEAKREKDPFRTESGWVSSKKKKIMTISHVQESSTSQDWKTKEG